VNLERFCVKFLVQGGSEVEDSTFIPIFHEWIRDHKLKGTLIDVADYSHVPEGPGIMLITHEINYAMDRVDGEFGLSAQQKLGEEGVPSQRIVNLVRQTAAFASLLESDVRVKGKIKLAGNKFYYQANDRLRAPNTDDVFAALKPDLEAAAAELYPGQSVNVTRIENDPRARLTAVVEVQNSVEMAALAA